MQGRGGRWTIAAVLAAAVFAGPAEAAGPVEIRLGFGGWTLEPLRSTIEGKCEDLIEKEFFKILNSVLPIWVLTPVQTSIDSTSSGRSFYAEVWLPLGQSRFSLGLRGDVFDFHIPFTASAHETVQFIGWTLADLSARGVGTVHLKGVGLSFLGRWKVLALRRFELALRAGVCAIPFQGGIETDETLLAETPLGDVELSGRLDETIAEIRKADDDVPAWLFAPALGLDLGYRIDSRLSVFGAISVSHGTFYSAGFSLAF